MRQASAACLEDIDAVGEVTVGPESAGTVLVSAPKIEHHIKYKKFERFTSEQIDKNKTCKPLQ